MTTEKIPAEIIKALEAEMNGLFFGCVTLKIQLHDGNRRFVISREQSIIPEKPSSGSNVGGRE